MGKYDKRSLSVRKNKLSKIKQEVEEKGLLFICVEFRGTNNYIYFVKNGEVRRQALGSFRKGNRLRKEYLETCWPVGSGLYKFYENEELVYIGKTKDFRDRFSSHFTKSKSNLFHAKGKITKIEICQLGESDTNILEMYLISKYKPKYNIKDVPKDEPTFIIQEPVFVEITGWK